MKSFNFTLTALLFDPEENPDKYVEALGENCSDALLGIGQMGKISLMFCREGTSAFAAIMSARKDVREAIPGCTLL